MSIRPGAGIRSNERRTAPARDLHRSSTLSPRSMAWTLRRRRSRMLGCSDLILEANSQNYQRTDATSLLNPRTDNRDDTLVWSYLAHRLGIEPGRVPRPSTKVVGIKSLAYFDRPRRRDGKPVHVGDFPAAVFETADRDGKTHAHRIYLTPGGAGKAELGSDYNGQRRKA